SFRSMAVLGFLFILLSLIAAVLSRSENLASKQTLLRVLFYSIPLTYLAGQLGWMTAEIGRQPWIVYNLLKTSDAVSKSVSVSQVWMSLIGFTLVYGLLGILDIYLLAKFSKKGPDDDLSGIVNPARS
ncbi:MAG: cytochrome ubiquinol oxidase subunit I, partial [Nitrospirota bacterium]